MSGIDAQERDTRPWYRYFWVWFVITPPATAVAAGIATIWLAMADPSGLVAGDYYKKGLAINRVIERDQAARRLGLEGGVRLEDGPPSRATLELESDEALDAPTLELRWLHPTRAGQDQSVRMQRVSRSPVRYVGRVEDLPPGDWHLQLEPPDESWRLVGRMKRPEADAAKLSPAVIETEPGDGTS